MLSGRRVVEAGARRVRERGRAAFARVLRLTGAATASYLAAKYAVADPRPITAALTALLIVQVTLVGTVADTLRRILSVVVGVGVAIAVSTFVGFTWWSLAAIIAASILIAQALRLGPHLLEVPISAMLILAAGGAGVLATDRIVETLVGAAVGLACNVVFPPAVQTRSAGAAVERFAGSIGRLLDRVSDSLGAREPSADEVRSWLQEARSITTGIVQVDQALNQAGESRRFNPRAAGTTDIVPDLRSGLESLEHSATALRAVFRSIADGVGVARAGGGDAGRGDGSDAGDRGGDAPAGGLADPDLRQAFAVLMADLARAVRGFGALVRSEVDRADEPHTAELQEALDSVREARALLTELLLADPVQAPGSWEAHGSLLAAVERVLVELDVEERLRRRRRRLLEAAAVRGPAALAAQRLRTTTRRVVSETPARRRRDRSP